jgi:DNA-binding NarL/FixJ family response regulator
VLVVDDHDLVGRALVSALEERGVCAHRCSGTAPADILTTAAEHPAGLVLLDLDLGRDAAGLPVDGRDVIGALTAEGWSVLVVTGSTDPQRVAAAIATGAIGEVAKSEPFDTMMSRILDAVAGRPVMSRDDHHRWLALHRAAQERQQRADELLGRLTGQERKVLDRMAEGHRAAAIAEEFVVSLTTVRSQIRAILAKLEVGSQLAAVALVHDRHPPE